MHRTSPVHADVFSHLPALLMREMDAPDVADLLDQLLAAGWRPGQLRHRVGAAPAQGSVTADAVHLRSLLGQLLAGPCPDAVRAQELAAAEEQRRWQERTAPRPASPEVRQAHLAAIRAELKGAPAPRREPEPRLRPACSLCGGEGAYFVTREVHLCRRCVEVLASGSARLAVDSTVPATVPAAMATSALG
jgi:ribosomal protein S14